ncbi:YceD family protein [Bacillus salitolerans]|uniref:YceD family protein n=1 Tax=Bacillus salitolerans TaxID=1437434 RepID=A0ABW4LKI5_9BACI
MKWHVHQLKKFQHKPLILDEVVDLSELKKRNHEIRDILSVHVTGKVDVSNDRATFHLHLTGTLVLPCSRTLVDVKLPFDITTTEHFLLQPALYEGDEDFHEPEGEVIDLLPVIEENILLEIPMQIFAENPDKEESAPQSGKDWQVISELDNQEKVDPRLAGLAKYFDKK